MSSSEPVHRGTLVCVVLKAKNLPNKRSIGKQDPYAVLQFGAEVQKTKADKRGGQHPNWDEQLHFEIYDDLEDAMKKGIGSGDSTIKASSNTAQKSRKGKGGAKILKVSCYADDARDPELIGEGQVDLTETLKTGEFDEWVTIKAKDRYAGEVYLELTFYSSAAPPKKKKVARPVNAGADTYGGAGTFEPIDGLDVPDVPPKASGHAPIPSSMRPSNGAKLGHQSRTSEASLATMPSSKSHSQLPSSGSALTITDIPSSLRPSTSLANIDAYTPPYAPSTLGRSQSPAPPVAAAPASSSEYDDGGRDFMPPMPSSLYGHGSQLSHASLASHHSVNDLASLASGRTRMHGMSSSVSYGNLPISSTIAQPPAQYNDPADELLRPMSSMSFSSRPSQVDKPLPPTTAVPQDPAPTLAPHQSYPYQHSYQASASSAPPYGGIQGQYALPAGQPPPPQHSSSYSHSYQHVAPTPPPFPASAPPGQYQNESGTPGRHSYAGPPPDLQPPLGHYDAHELARPASPAARPHSAASYHLSSSVLSGPTPSVINAQAYYQPPPQPARAPSPSPPVAPGSSYGPPPPQQHYQSNGACSQTPPPGPVSYPSRPLPSTQPPPPPLSHSPAVSTPMYGQPQYAHAPPPGPTPPPGLPPASQFMPPQYGQWPPPPPSQTPQPPPPQTHSQYAAPPPPASAYPPPPPPSQYATLAHSTSLSMLHGPPGWPPPPPSGYYGPPPPIPQQQQQQQHWQQPPQQGAPPPPQHYQPQYAPQ